MAVKPKTNVVNLDALIPRADLAVPSDETGNDIEVIQINGLERKGMLYPGLRKPDFQRETANWSPEQVADLVSTFARREMIPSIILWRAGSHVFVIDGAHRLSALIAWVQNDYGDGEKSREFFQNEIPKEQKAAADRTRALIEAEVGSWDDHKKATEKPDNVRADIVARASRIAWQSIDVQWIKNADHEKAEKSFFRINQGGTKIDPTETRIIKARGSATALASRAILRGGTGNSYWRKFPESTRADIEDLGREIHALLFEPRITLPIQTLDLPPAGFGYGPGVLPFVFDLVNLVNSVAVPDSSNKRITTKEPTLVDDPDGKRTVSYLRKVLELARRLCSKDPSSVGLAPALYFYTESGVFQPASFLSFVGWMLPWKTADYSRFTDARRVFEDFLLANRKTTEAVRSLGSGGRSRPRLVHLYDRIIADAANGKSAETIAAELVEEKDFDFMKSGSHETHDRSGEAFTRDVKGTAYLAHALPGAALRCATCDGLLYSRAMQVGHREAKRLGGSGNASNAIMQHPFCNSTHAN